MAAQVTGVAGDALEKNMRGSSPIPFQAAKSRPLKTASAGPLLAASDPGLLWSYVE